MAKETEPKPVSPLQKAWDEYVANYIKSSPKGKAKEARGEFKDIAPSFEAAFKAKHGIIS